MLNVITVKRTGGRLAADPDGPVGLEVLPPPHAAAHPAATKISDVTVLTIP